MPRESSFESGINLLKLYPSEEMLWRTLVIVKIVLSIPTTIVHFHVKSIV